MGLTLASLDQQVIVITGASSGIGLVTARMAAQRGAAVVLAARNDGALEELAAEIRAVGGQAIAVGADVGDQGDMARIADRALQHFGRFDTWVNNAGVSIFGRIEEVAIEDMRRMFDTVYWGVVYGSLQAVAHYKRRGTAGAIVQVGSLFGDRATPLQSTYASAKHAVHGFTEALRMELEAEDAPVSVTLVHPGRIDTPYNEHAHSYADRHPAHRVYVYTPETVAAAILHAAEHPARDLYVGSQAKALAILGRLAPRLTDKAMERYMYWGQQDPDRPSPPREESALHQPGRDPLRERGSHPGLRRSHSFYLTGQEHRRARDAALAGVAAAAAVAIARRRVQRRSAPPPGARARGPARPRRGRGEVPRACAARARGGRRRTRTSRPPSSRPPRRAGRARCAPTARRSARARAQFLELGPHLFVADEARHADQ